MPNQHMYMLFWHRYNIEKYLKIVLISLSHSVIHFQYNNNRGNIKYCSKILTNELILEPALLINYFFPSMMRK